jgi:hypothetical protein
MKSQSLAIQNQPAQKLSSQQQTFNRNIKKVESLQRDIVRFGQQLDNTLAYYAKEVLPVIETKRAVGKSLLSLFFSFLQKPKFLRPAQKRTMKTMMQNIMNDFLNYHNNEPDAETKKIFQVIFGSSYEAAKEEAFEEVKMEMKDMFDQMGVDMNMDFLKSNMTEEEMARHAHRMREEMFAMEEEARQRTTSNKGETKREIKERLAKEAQDKSISTIYKSLAKTLHPDLEQDESKKGEKEELMKRVTVAYQKKDLHTLLKIELEVLYSEERNIDKLSNEKIKIYNELLREQVEELQMQIDMLPQHPRYAPLLQFVYTPTELFHLDLRDKVKEIKRNAESMKRSLSVLQGNEKEAEIELMTILKESEQAERISKKRESMMITPLDFDDYDF